MEKEKRKEIIWGIIFFITLTVVFIFSVSYGNRKNRETRVTTSNLEDSTILQIDEKCYFFSCKGKKLAKKLKEKTLMLPNLEVKGVIETSDGTFVLFEDNKNYPYTEKG